MNRQSIIRVGDLIEIPEVKTVIELAETRDLDPEDPSGRSSLEILTSSFVITEEIHGILTIILRALVKHEGRGFFIAGNYGSGKSHLLSVIALLARHTWAWASLRTTDPDLLAVKTQMADRQYLPILIPLTEYRSDIPLEDIVWHSMELSAAADGIPLALSHSNRFIALFDKYVRPVHDAAFTRFLHGKVGDDYQWERICRDDPAAAHTLILQFLDSSKEPIPFRLQPERKTLLGDLTQAVTAAGFNGVIVILDELSEYLKSKSDPHALNEDARFLQFLGESSLHHPVWIIGALQENLERACEIREAVFKKIKDRYSHRLRLSSHHIRELISQRLIRHKSGARESILNTYKSIQNAFGRFKISAEEFLQIYPVHPETLELLDKNSDLFSRHRGIVDFLSARIAGRPDDNIPGMLDFPAETLLCPHMIFDHFQDRIIESAEYAHVYRLYTEHFEPRIERLFDDPVQRRMATSLVKLLIILEITPLKERYTVRDLANMLLVSTIDSQVVAGDFNYRFIHDSILAVIYQQIGHVQVEEGDSFLEHVYRLDVKQDSARILERRLDQVKSDTTALDPAVIRSVCTAISFGAFPAAYVLNRYAIREGIFWENTYRKICVWLGDITVLDDAHWTRMRQALHQGKFDLALLVAWPSNIARQEVFAQKFLATEAGTTSTGFCFLFPRIPENIANLQAFLELYACQTVIAEFSQHTHSDSTQILTRVNSRLNDALDDSRKILESIFSSGSMILSTGRQTVTVNSDPNNFDAFLQALVPPALSNRYPEHYKVAPRTEFGSRIVLENLLDRMIRPGQIKTLRPGRDDALGEAIQQVMLPLGLAQKTTSGYSVAVQPKRSAAALLILQEVSPGGSAALEFNTSHTSLAGLKTTLGTSPYGISGLVVDLTVLVLLRKGYLRGFCNGSPVPFHAVTLPLEQSAPDLAPGELLPRRHHAPFAEIYRLITRRQLAELDIDTQVDTWTKFMKLLDKLRNELSEFETGFVQLRELYTSDTADLPETTAAIKKFKDLCGSMNTESDHTHGWMNLFEEFSNIHDLIQLLETIRRLSAFHQVGRGAYMDARRYIEDQRLEIPDTDEYMGLRKAHADLLTRMIITDELLLNDGVRTALAEFERFRNAYTSEYLQKHRAIQDSLNIPAVAEIRNSLEYKLLEKISRHPDLPFPEDPGRIIEQVHRYLDSGCTGNPDRELANSPVCRCGIQLGTASVPAGAAELREKIQAGLRGFVMAVQRDFQADPPKIDTLSKEVRSNLKTLMELDPGDPVLPTRLNAILDVDTLTEMGRFGTTQRKTVQRSLEVLQSQLLGKRIRRERILKLVRDWLASGEQIDDEDLIEIK